MVVNNGNQASNENNYTILMHSLNGNKSTLNKLECRDDITQS